MHTWFDLSWHVGHFLRVFRSFFTCSFWVMLLSGSFLTDSAKQDSFLTVPVINATTLLHCLLTPSPSIPRKFAEFWGIPQNWKCLGEFRKLFGKFYGELIDFCHSGSHPLRIRCVLPEMVNSLKIFWVHTWSLCWFTRQASPFTYEYCRNATLENRLLLVKSYICTFLKSWCMRLVQQSWGINVSCSVCVRDLN